MSILDRILRGIPKKVNGTMSWAGLRSRVMYDDWARRYEVEFEGYGYVAPRKVLQLVLDRIDAKKEQVKILDVGVGTGWLSAQFKNACDNAHLTGVDVSQEMLNKCARKSIMDELHRVDFQAEGLQFDPDSYDAVVSSGVFELLSDPEDVILEMARVCRRGGVVCFTTLCPTYNARSIDGNVHNDRSLRQAMTDGGLNVVGHTDFVAYRREEQNVPYRVYMAQKQMP